MNFQKHLNKRTDFYEPVLASGFALQCYNCSASHKSVQRSYANSVKAGERISKEFNKPVYVINSKNLSGALGLNPVISMNDNGKSLLFGKTFNQEANLSKIY